MRLLMSLVRPLIGLRRCLLMCVRSLAMILGPLCVSCRQIRLLLLLAVSCPNLGRPPKRPIPSRLVRQSRSRQSRHNRSRQSLSLRRRSSPHYTILVYIMRTDTTKKKDRREKGFSPAPYLCTVVGDVVYIWKYHKKEHIKPEEGSDNQRARARSLYSRVCAEDVATAAGRKTVC